MCQSADRMNPPRFREVATRFERDPTRPQGNCTAQMAPHCALQRSELQADCIRAGSNRFSTWTERAFHSIRNPLHIRRALSRLRDRA